MSVTADQIFLLAVKRSKENENTIYCIGIYKLGTPNSEFIMGELNNDRNYSMGDEVPYIYSADYTKNLQNAVKWLDKVK